MGGEYVVPADWLKKSARGPAMSLRRDLWWLVRDLRRDEGLTVLLVTHDLTETFFLTERIGVLIDGRLEQCGPRETVYRRPATLPVARFLGIRPEEVPLRDADHPPREGEVMLAGRFDLNDLGAQTLVHFHHGTSPLVLELQVSGRVARRFGLFDGRTGVAVGLPTDALFWVPETETRS